MITQLREKLFSGHKYAQRPVIEDFIKSSTHWQGASVPEVERKLKSMRSSLTDQWKRRIRKAAKSGSYLM